MPRFRKKPIEIEAMQLRAYTELLPPTDPNSAGGEIWQWMDEHDVEIRCEQNDPGPAYGVIPTLEGDMRADIGDWIICGVKGEFYPCKPDIFEATYDLVPSDASNAWVHHAMTANCRCDRGAPECDEGQALYQALTPAEIDRLDGAHASG